MSELPLPLSKPGVAEEPEELYRDHADWLASTLRRRFGPEAAEDVAQETWLRLLASDAASRVRSPRAFLLRIAANLMIDRRRRRARRPEAATADAPAGAAQGADQLELLALKQIVLGLPAPLRDVFVLSRYEGMTYQSIAAHLNISVKTVEWRMSRALALCAERLRD